MYVIEYTKPELSYDSAILCASETYQVQTKNQNTFFSKDKLFSGVYQKIHRKQSSHVHSKGGKAWEYHWELNANKETDQVPKGKLRAEFLTGKEPVKWTIK